jgi:hypothetical protein
MTVRARAKRKIFPLPLWEGVGGGVSRGSAPRANHRQGTYIESAARCQVAFFDLKYRVDPPHDSFAPAGARPRPQPPSHKGRGNALSVGCMVHQ